MPDLPFQVGGLAESRSFQVGFRGAWFRCKVYIVCSLKFKIFPIDIVCDTKKIEYEATILRLITFETYLSNVHLIKNMITIL